MVDFPTIAIPITSRAMLAHIGNSITVSFGMNNSSVSPREYSPPMPAVVSISATEIMPFKPNYTISNFIMLNELDDTLSQELCEFHINIDDVENQNNYHILTNCQSVIQCNK